MSFQKVKISLDQITWGPRKEVDHIVAWVLAGEIMQKGYRKVSNAYCRLARIDRDDWLDVLAKQLQCSRADFYKLDGSGIDDQWRDQYVRVYSRDVLTVHPQIAKIVKPY